MDKLKILVVDDESRMRKLVKDFLVKAGYEILEAGDGEQAIDIFMANKDIALILLDVMMPKMDGFETCKEIRKYSDVPIIMLTAKSDERDELAGFGLGVDEYITKPFSPKILVARVEAVLRRSGDVSQESILEVGDIKMDLSAHIVQIKGNNIDLSFKEFELLNYFIVNKGVALSREKILNNVWNYDYYGDARTIDTHVKKLRSKLGECGDYIKTIWGMGYKFEVSEDEGNKMKKPRRAKRSTRIKYSIRIKISLCLTAILTVIILMSALISVAFIKRYFYSQTKNQMISTYESYDRKFSKSDNIDFRTFNDNTVNDAGAYVYILDVSHMLIYTTVNKENKVYDKLTELAGVLLYNEDDMPDNIKVEDKTIYSHYSIQLSTDTDSGYKYFDLMGYLSDGSPIIVRVPAARVNNTIKTITMFFCYVLIVVAAIGCILMYFFSNIFAIPIKRLTAVAKKMTDMDFDARIENPSNDEIGELAICMNELADRLSTTLNELQEANSKLQTDIEEKIAIDDMRKEFLSHVSHELKTPIALVLGYAEGLKDNINDDEESRNFYCEVIMDEAEKMNKLVKQLLELNEIEFGQNRVTREDFLINDLIKNVIASSSILIEQKKAVVVDEVPADINVYADEFMIEQVFTNYLTNAIHYCNEEGNVRIYSEARYYDEMIRNTAG